jgi:leader peptidase (prepilin peptidase)/N-methyltransferase
MLLSLAQIPPLLFLAVYDWKFFKIPNSVIGIGFLITAVGSLGFDVVHLLEASISAIVSAGFLIVLRFAGGEISGRQVMGLGDVKLAAWLGFMFGWQVFLLIIWVAALSATVYDVCCSLLDGGKFRGRLIPFGSFMAVVSILTILIPSAPGAMLEPWGIIWI